MTRNEARADNNLPPVEGGDELIVPLNVVAGGQASPQDTHMDEQIPMTIESGIRLNSCDCPECKAKAEPVRIKARSTDEEDKQMTETLAKFFKRQANAILPKIGAGSDKWWNQDRWDSELADDITPLMNDIADAHGKEVAKQIGSEYNTEQTRAWLRKCAEGRANAINLATLKKLTEALESEDEERTPAHVLEIREQTDSARLGGKLARDIAGWAAIHEAISQASQQGIEKHVQKRWVTGENPREEHAAMNGETVDIDEPFSNGCDWPGDDNGDPDTTCGCNCSTEVIITI